MAGLLDVTNPAGVLWYNKKLLRLQKLYNITSFKVCSLGSKHICRVLAVGIMTLLLNVKL